MEPSELWTDIPRPAEKDPLGSYQDDLWNVWAYQEAFSFDDIPNPRVSDKTNIAPDRGHLVVKNRFQLFHH